ncbi:MAG: hypothetical protein AAFO29_05045, partial [Actinomycetota bacterium]
MSLRFDDIELGDDLPVEHPDLSLPAITRFTEGSDMRFPRFLDHEAAKAEGLPGALVPGLLSQEPGEPHVGSRGEPGDGRQGQIGVFD